MERAGARSGGGVVTGVRESLLGPSYFYHRRLIEKSKGWSPSEIREYQDNAVPATDPQVRR